MADELPPESDLRRALAADLPDPEAFLAGVTRRVREGEQAQAEERQRFQEAPTQVQVAQERLSGHEQRVRARQECLEQAPPGLRVAAGALPPGLLSAGLAVTSAGGKQFGAKAIPGLLSIPVVSLFMVFLGFGLGVRSLFRGQRPSGEEYSSRAEATVAWWEHNKRRALLSLVILGGLAVSGYSEMVIVLLLVSMAVAVLQVRQLARAGLADVGGVGRHCAHLLFNLATFGLMLRDLLGRPPHLVLAALICLFGSLACLALSGTLTPAHGAVGAFGGEELVAHDR